MKNVKIAITGGIGSGKTALVNLIKEMGYPVFSCDEICRELYKKRKVLKKIKSLFPTAIKGKIFLKADKKEISRLTFEDKENNEKLKKLLHPLIMENLIKSMGKGVGLIFAEVPLLFEGGFEKDFDKVIVVKREKEKRFDGVNKRSKLTREQTEKIMLSQVDYDNLDLSPYIVVENDGSLEDLKEKAINIIKEILK
ncbi:MAG: dephospho-CoA kinase [Clostridia bacterium]|nr:dephospho-CoA kinase [Clostridia bacterium]